MPHPSERPVRMEAHVGGTRDVKQVEVTCHLMSGDFFKKYVYTLL
jgi:hypothetical protein